MTTSLAEKTNEVVANNRAHGWYDNGLPPFKQSMALLHSEVSEALEAWRRWGLEDRTQPWYDEGQPDASPCPKPEGVGSEFADVFIRLLDDAWLYGELDLERGAGEAGKFGLSDSFPGNIDDLHNLIALASMSIEGTIGHTLEEGLGAILLFLRQLCEEYGIDLEAEYARKMVYSRTRPYKHGGKAI